MSERKPVPDRPGGDANPKDLPAGGPAAPETRPTEATRDRPAIEAFDAEGAGFAAKE